MFNGIAKFFSPPKKSINWVTANLAEGPAPTTIRQINFLKNNGIQAILNLCAECPWIVENERKAGFEVYFLPVEDEDVPSWDELEKALTWLEENIFLGKKVYIHCKYGIGRTGTILAAYLCRRGMSLKQVESVLKSLRAKPESYPQWQLLLKYQKTQGHLKELSPCISLECGLHYIPFFKALQKIYNQVESFYSPNQRQCGKEHSLCCRKGKKLFLVEAYYLQFNFNLALNLNIRNKILNNLNSNMLCPLNNNSSCILFNYRPFDCRLSDFATKDIERLNYFKNKIFKINMSFLKVNFQIKNFQHKFDIEQSISGKYVQSFFSCIVHKK
ncbi:Protein-tyrosine phosphatase [Desulfonauticus submarinus]|uniref:Protein-tyrosine phosphatase n=1 Tax=Desulfonauticus submarinus TaxID=206665 RepID=A0A1H0FGV2_9BACT|nr:dual specificity protein phosphatase family protein [Desulfonauticus submarinus]SDN93814.1 Protein-tyrosine phosphatase [Desulfonauticus submarinus]